MEKIKIGYLGLGKRGKSMLKTMLDSFKNVEVTHVCDYYEDRVAEGIEIVKEYTGKTPYGTTNPDEIMKSDVDAVMIMTAWEAHIALAISAMKHGKRVGVEVAGAYKVEDCFKLVEAYEETGVPLMLLENCCYGKKELNVLKMVREGLFGEIVHCSGGYHHHLRNEISRGKEIRHYRLRNYIGRNCENYPTHELGPIAKVLDINRGNRMVQLSSVASKARGLKEFIKNKEELSYLKDTEFKQGDIITTIITCADGSTITLTLDTTLPRQYSRGFTVRGTKAAYFEDNDSFFFENNAEHEADHENWKKHWGNAEEYRKQYNHPIWEKYEDAAAKSGHDGMDYMVIAAFLESVEKKAEPPIDVYDAAAWMAITPLSEESINKGGAPVAIPDFTTGRWMMYEKKESDLEFALD